MAEIRINATGGLKLYDADDSHYAQIIAGTITSNTDVMTLGHNVINIPMTTASSSATTGALTIGGGLGVAADLYVGDDAYLITDSAVLGFGADKDTTLTHTDGTGLTLNSTNKLTFGDAASYINQSSDGVLTIAGEATIDLTASTAVLVSNDLKLDSDSSVIGFGADNDTTLTHTDGTGLTLNSTNKICFNDASQFIQGSSNAILALGATDEIDLTATAIDINGTCDISGTFSLGGTNITTTAAEINLIDGGTARGTTAIADGDGVLINDAGTMRMTSVETLATYIGGGITVADVWRVTASQTIGTGNEDISADNGGTWSRVNSDGYGVVGSAMSVSSEGYFTFPSTGMYWIFITGSLQKNGNSRYNDLNIYTTGDGFSSSMLAATGRGFVTQTDSNTTLFGMHTAFLYDVANTTNNEVKFNILAASGDLVLGADSGVSMTQAVFIRLGDT